MPKNFYNHLGIYDLTPYQKRMILDTFICDQCDDSKNYSSRLLSTFCPEPNYTHFPVACTDPLVKACNAQNTDEFIDALVNRPTVHDDSWIDWRLQNWGTQYEFNNVVIKHDDSSGDISLSFATESTPPLEGIFNMSKCFSNATFELGYIQLGDNECGTMCVRNCRAYNQVFDITWVAHIWIRHAYPDLYSRLQSDNSLMPKLSEIASTNYLVAIQWFLKHVSDCFGVTLANGNPESDIIQWKIGSETIDLDINQYVPSSPFCITPRMASYIASQDSIAEFKEKMSIK